MNDFEKILNEMPKPEVSVLKHQDLLAKNIFKAKRKTAISWWWVCIPLYILGAFIMKGFYRHPTSLSMSLSAFTLNNRYTAYLLFVVLPLAALMVNGATILKPYGIPGYSKSAILSSILPNILIIVFAIIVLLTYLLN